MSGNDQCQFCQRSLADEWEVTERACYDCFRPVYDKAIAFGGVHFELGVIVSMYESIKDNPELDTRGIFTTIVGLAQLWFGPHSTTANH